MALEAIEGAGKYINNLDENNPLSSDTPGTDGDNHLRGIKNTIKNTFPSITGPVTATHGELNILDGVTATTAEINLLDGVTATTAEINYVDGVTSNVQTQIDNANTYQGFEVNLTSAVAMTENDVHVFSATNYSAFNESIDTDSWFNATTGVFLPNKAGYYQINLSFEANGLTAYFTAFIYKNGSMVKRFTSAAETTGKIHGSAVIYLNGSTDYIDIRVATSDTSWSMYGGQYTWVDGHFIGS